MLAAKQAEEAALKKRQEEEAQKLSEEAKKAEEERVAMLKHLNDEVARIKIYLAVEKDRQTRAKSRGGDGIGSGAAGGRDRGGGSAGYMRSTPPPTYPRHLQDGKIHMTTLG